MRSSQQKKHDNLYNIAEETSLKNRFDETRNFLKNDLRLDLSQRNAVSKKPPPNVFEFENEKELNKIYDGFFNEDNKKPAKPVNANSFRNSYLSEMNDFNETRLNESYRPKFY